MTETSKITFADGSSVEVNAKYTTARRYITNAYGPNNPLAEFELLEGGRISVNPAHVVSLTENK